MDSRLVNIGFGNAVRVSRILAVVNPGSSPIRKLKEDARTEKKLIDVTEGRRTRAIVILDSGQHSQLAFHGNVELVRVFDHLLGQLDILFVRQVRSVDHYR